MNKPTQKEEVFIEYDDSVSFMARLRDRIVNRGMVPIFEADDVIQGGHAKGIEHLEDLVFRRGSAGIREALSYLDHLRDNAKECVSCKFDGKPSIVFGRNDAGEFVLTDNSGFNALGYNGLFTSLEQLANHMAHRDRVDRGRGRQGDRVNSLVPQYARLWPLLLSALPPRFRGYIQGDLLYTECPAEESGNLVFTPNTVTYRIPRASALGESIADSHVGIAMHTRFSEPGTPSQPLGTVRLLPVPGLNLIPPQRPRDNVIPERELNVRQLSKLLRQHGADIDTLFSPTELRAMQISDLPRLCVDYVNSLVADVLVEGFSADEMIPGFVEFLRRTVTPRKMVNIREYLQSPTSNGDALAAAFSAFMLMHDIKLDLLQQLDRQYPGQEGWVIATPEGTAKLVNRFGFTRANRLKNAR